MKRHFSILVLSLAFVLSQTPALLDAQTPAPTTDGQSLIAGPFSVSAPHAWAASAYTEKVPSHPLYSAEDWKKLQESSLYTLKPGYDIRPQHWAIRFPALVLKGQTFDRQRAGGDPVAPQILIHQADGWSTIQERGEADPKKAAETRLKLRESLTALATEIPHDLTPVLADGTLGFISLKKKLRFKGGHGYRMITQWTFESDLIRRGGVHYLFIGLSDDDSCQILASFPVDVPDLPSAEVDAEHLGYSVQRYEELSQNINAYHDAAVAWIEKREKQFTPSLDALDRLIESLSADTWR